MLCKQSTGCAVTMTKEVTCKEVTCLCCVTSPNDPDITFLIDPGCYSFD
jgi:hypothetical protein